MNAPIFISYTQTVADAILDEAHAYQFPTREPIRSIRRLRILDPAPRLMTHAAAGIKAAPEASTGEGGSTTRRGAGLTDSGCAPNPGGGRCVGGFTGDVVEPDL
jgi:hypothetical protein